MTVFYLWGRCVSGAKHWTWQSLLSLAPLSGTNVARLLRDNMRPCFTCDLHDKFVNLHLVVSSKVNLFWRMFLLDLLCRFTATSITILISFFHSFYLNVFSGFYMFESILFFPQWWTIFNIKNKIIRQLDTSLHCVNLCCLKSFFCVEKQYCCLCSVLKWSNGYQNTCERLSEE